ncbi:GIY-YIG nuclease family protein [Micromonospora tulbaghiae]|uniref:GIY-YIG nuclease family protein n=1 Tax=Micromonospora tulbaghiae TaxID=479978 RepID=UPI003EBA503C
MSKGRRGVIYILANQYMPGLLKIGQTTRDPETRAREISRATGVPGDFEIIYDEIVSDVDSAEAAIHAQLAALRVNRPREFFRIDIRAAIRAVQQVCRNFAVDEHSEAEGVEILPELETRMRRWLRREIVSVEFVQFSDLCLLRVTEQPNITSVNAFQTVVDLRVLGNSNDEFGDEMLFNPKRAMRENVEIFLDLDAYSMIMTDLGLLHDEASHHVAHLVEQAKVEPPIIPVWKVSSIKYDMWGSAITDNEPLLRLLRENDSRRFGALYFS